MMSRINQHVFLGICAAASAACGDAAPAGATMNTHEPATGRDAAASVEADASKAPAGVDAGAAPCATGQISCDDTCIPAIATTAAAVEERIFARSCALSSSCHTGTAPQEGLDLTSVDTLFATAVGKPSKQKLGLSIIDPGHPENSYLIHKLRNQDIAALSSVGAPATSMPPPPSIPLCEAKIQVLAAWIAGGATR